MKDEVCRIGRVTNFPISRELISSVKNVQSKYVADLQMQKKIQSKEKLEQETKKKEQDVLQTQKEKIDELELKLSSQKSSLKLTEESIKEGNIERKMHFRKKHSQEEKFKKPRQWLTWDLIENVLKKILGKSLKRKLN